MAEVTPFRGIRYDESIALDEVVAPPYDVIPAAQAAELRQRSPHNAVHLDLPVAPGEAAQDAASARAAAAFERWQAGGVLIREARPSLYLVDQTYRGPDGRERTRRGFIARLRLADFAERVVLPHERTHASAKVDRLRLYRAPRGRPRGPRRRRQSAPHRPPGRPRRRARRGSAARAAPLHRRRPPPLRDGAHLPRRATRRRRPRRRHADGLSVQHDRSRAHRVSQSSPRARRRRAAPRRAARTPAAVLRGRGRTRPGS